MYLLVSNFNKESSLLLKHLIQCHYSLSYLVWSRLDINQLLCTKMRNSILYNLCGLSVVSFVNNVQEIQQWIWSKISNQHQIYCHQCPKPNAVRLNSWWRHQMETFSPLLAIFASNSPVPGEFPAQRPVTRSFDVFFDLHPNKRLSKQWWGWWFETPSCPLWRHRNVLLKLDKGWVITSRW